MAPDGGLGFLLDAFFGFRGAVPVGHHKAAFIQQFLHGLVRSVMNVCSSLNFRALL
jgi:hypothetical protein